MQRVDTSSFDIYVGFGQRRGNDTLHWILILAHPGSDRCTWYHVTGGPTQARGYMLQIQANKRLDSFGIASKRWISKIPAIEINKVKAAANAVPLQRCQRWTTAVLAGLERKRLVPEGTSADFENQIEPSRFEQASNRGSSQANSRSGRAGITSRPALPSGSSGNTTVGRSLASLSSVQSGISPYSVQRSH